MRREFALWFCPADTQAPSPTSADFFGGHSEEDPPVPIPNTEVKLFSADGTAWETMWESRSPPILYKKPPFNQRLNGGFFWAYKTGQVDFTLEQIDSSSLLLSLFLERVVLR